MKKRNYGLLLVFFPIFVFADPVGVGQTIPTDIGLMRVAVRETSPFDACMDVVEKIYLFNYKVNGRSTTMGPDWSNPSKLEEDLGPACKRENIEKIYHWTQYALVVQNGYAVKQEGDTPAALENTEHPKSVPSLEQALNTLGEPKSIEVHKGMQYNWVCGETGATLQIIEYEDGTHRYSGTYCAFPTMCDPFRFSYKPPAVIQNPDNSIP